LWTETGGERQLTKNGGVDQVLLSDDRQIIAFRRGNGLWAVNADGSDERQLVNERDLPIPQDGALAGGVTDMTVYRVDWIPDSHQLLFNTSPQIEGPGLFLSDDLWWVDADSQTLVNMFAPSEGGQFTISPDGRRVALVTPESISVAGLEGQDKERVFSYTPVSTYSEVQYYARPVWSPEGDNLAVVIPPPDPLAAEINAYGVWIMAANGESARLNGSLEIQGRGLFEPSISPTLETIAYPSSPEVEPERTDLLLVSWEDTIGDPMFYASQVGSFYDWSPGGERFSFTRPPGETAAFSIFTGQMDEEPQLVGNGESLTRNVHWVDDNSYLYLQASDRGWELLLSDSSGAVTLIASVGGQSPRFDAVR
jgi:hypothetical protein